MPPHTERKGKINKKKPFGPRTHSSVDDDMKAVLEEACTGEEGGERARSRTRRKAG